LVATLPPMEQISKLEGSGGYHNPCSRAAAFTSALSAPGWATARRDGASMSMRRIRSVDSVMPPSTASEPPERPVPAPLGTTGTACSAAQQIVADTSLVELARTTANG